MCCHAWWPTTKDPPPTGALRTRGTSVGTMSGATDTMRVLEVRKAKVAHPTGDPNFAVLQPHVIIRPHVADTALLFPT